VRWSPKDTWQHPAAWLEQPHQDQHRCGSSQLQALIQWQCLGSALCWCLTVWCSLLQAGVAMGLARIAGTAFPEWGPAFQTVMMAIIIINMLVGPPLFRLALIQVSVGCGRSGQDAPGGMYSAVAPDLWLPHLADLACLLPGLMRMDVLPCRMLGVKLSSMQCSCKLDLPAAWVWCMMYTCGSPPRCRALCAACAVHVI